MNWGLTSLERHEGEQIMTEFSVLGVLSLKAWNTLHVDASCGKSEPVCRLQLTDSTENHVVYDGHRLWFFLALDLDSIQSEDIKHVRYFQPILEHI